MNSKDFKNIFNYRHPNTITGEIKKSTKEIIEKTKETSENLNKQIQKSTQSKINYHEPNITLFDLYIKYRTITKSSLLINKILDNIENKLNLINRKIKDFYWGCCYKWNESITDINGNKTLKEWIEYEINQFINKKILFTTKEFVLPKEYKISTSKFNINTWDRINTFNLSVNENGFDSEENEKRFYERLKDKYEDNEDNIHIFRNGTNQNYDYYIEYLDKEKQKRQFYPDYIIINDKTKHCLILEAKGKNIKNDIDKNTKWKLEALNKALKDNQIKNKYSCNKAIKVSGNNSNVEFNANGEILTWDQLNELIKKY